MIRPGLKSVSITILYVAGLSVLLIPLYMYFSHDVTELIDHYPHNIAIEKADPVYELRKDIPKNWVKLKSVSKYVKWAIVLSEDWDFYHHDGIDTSQMKVAFEEMLKGKRFRGASTISQQMVKNVYLNQDRSLWRKLHELILTQKVENVLSKDRILEIYLNCIEFGPNIYGIRKAAYHFFKKGPGEIGPKEGAFLAMMLPSPKKYYISYKEKKLTPFARSRIRAILIKMRMGKVLTFEEYERILGESLSWE